MSGYYRIINKAGGYTWMQTCATLICSNPNPTGGSASKCGVNNPANNSGASSSSNVPSPAPSVSGSVADDQEQSIICVNYVLRYV